MQPRLGTNMRNFYAHFHSTLPLHVQAPTHEVPGTPHSIQNPVGYCRHYLATTCGTLTTHQRNQSTSATSDLKAFANGTADSTNPSQPCQTSVTATLNSSLRPALLKKSCEHFALIVPVLEAACTYTYRTSSCSCV